LSVGNLRLRLTAARHDLDLGTSFEATLRETWCTRGPPEEQAVVWTFESPSGIVEDVSGDYVGDFTWRVRFAPAEPGIWTYTWSHRLSPSGGQGAGEFYVVPRDMAAIKNALEDLAEKVGAATSSRLPENVERMRGAFMRLERGALSLLDPIGYRSDEGRSALAELRRVRGILWGRPVPDPLPKSSMPLEHTWDGRPLRDPFPRPEMPTRGSARAVRAMGGYGRRLLRRVRRRLAGPGPQRTTRAGDIEGSTGQTSSE